MASKRALLSSALFVARPTGLQISRHCVATKTPFSIRSTRPILAPRRAIRARLYSQANDHHEIAATGSKIWNFEQVRELAKDASKKVLIIDAREPGELQQTGKIPGAINIPITTAPESFHVTDEEFELRYGFERPSKDAEMVIYCKAGVRSRAAAALAREAGFKNVGEYPGSWLDWEKNGGEAERFRKEQDSSA